MKILDNITSYSNILEVLIHPYLSTIPENDILEKMFLKKNERFYIPSNEQGYGFYDLDGYSTSQGFIFKFYKSSSMMFPTLTYENNISFQMLSSIKGGGTSNSGTRVYHGKFVNFWYSILSEIDLVEKIKNSNDDLEKNYLLGLIILRKFLFHFISTYYGYQYNNTVIHGCLFQSRRENHQKDVIEDFKQWKVSGISNYFKLRLEGSSTTCMMGITRIGEDCGMIIDEILSLNIGYNKTELIAIFRNLLIFDEFKYIFDTELIHTKEYYQQQLNLIES